MTIYSFNKSIGWASSGIEYAQAYRSKILKKNNQRAKFIFTDHCFGNIQPLTENMGFDDSEIINLYQYFTDVKISPTTFSLKKLEETFGLQIVSQEENENQVKYIFKNHLQIIAYKEKFSTDSISKVEYISNGELYRRDYYSYVKLFQNILKKLRTKTMFI